VSSDPEPTYPVRYFHTERAVVQPDANRAESSDRLELQRWVLRIGLQQLVILVREIADFAWQAAISGPEGARRVGASKECRSTRSVLRESLVSELIQAAARYISFDLTIPLRTVELREPATKPFKLGRGERFDAVFDLLEFSHARILSNLHILRAASTGSDYRER
jgi:hypothetical protein